MTLNLILPAPEQPIRVVYAQQPLKTSGFPTDILFTDSTRKEYSTGKLRLVVPKMRVDTTVGDGTDEVTLQKSPGLYDYSQLPSEGNSNVSIAGHRDCFGSPFIDIDQLTTGDMIFLCYNGKTYCYDWVETKIIESDDWSILYCHDFSAVTLTSCDPVGISTQRIAAIGKLVEVREGELLIL